MASKPLAVITPGILTTLGADDFLKITIRSMSLKKAYYYLFYKVFNFFEAAPFNWWSEWKATSTISAAIYLLLFSLIEYYDVFISRISVSDNKQIICLVIACVSIMYVNYFIFNHQNKWKVYKKEFDKFSKKKNLIGTLLVLLFFILIITIFILVFYFMSQINRATTNK